MAGSRRQAEFLRQLLHLHDTPEHRDLGARIQAAEKDVRSMQRACRAVGLTAAFSLAGLGYCAVLLPGFFDSTMPMAVRILCILCLGCGLSFLAFWGMSQWHRAILDRLHEQARQRVLVHLAVNPSPSRVLPVDGTPSGLGTQGDEADKIIVLPKAS